jgi:hypothetical protein
MVITLRRNYYERNGLGQPRIKSRILRGFCDESGGRMPIAMRWEEGRVRPAEIPFLWIVLARVQSVQRSPLYSAISSFEWKRRAGSGARGHLENPQRTSAISVLAAERRVASPQAVKGARAAAKPLFIVLESLSLEES